LNDLIAIAEDILSAFTQTPDGFRARAGRVQFGKWRDQIEQAKKELTDDFPDRGTAENAQGFKDGAAAERERIVAQLGRRADELASMLAIDDEADHDRNISVGALRYAIEDLTP
jgi:hypothetical protein